MGGLYDLTEEKYTLADIFIGDLILSTLSALLLTLAVLFVAYGTFDIKLFLLAFTISFSFFFCLLVVAEYMFKVRYRNKYKNKKRY